MTRWVPLKRVVTFNDETLPESTPEDTTIRYIEISDVRESEGIINSAELTFGDAPSRARRIIRPGDVLVSTVRTYLRAVAAVGEDYDGAIASTGFAVLRATSLDHRFLKYAVLDRAFMDQVVARSTGVSYPAINASDLVSIKIPAPPIAAQRAIANYLDRETAQIDAFIAKNEELITLLTERRAATITRAVTKGLENGVAMKESGVEALGAIPDGWTVNRIRDVGRAIIGLTYSPEDICGEGEGGTLVLRAGNIQGGSVDLDDCVYVRKPIPDALRLTRGDIVICARNGSARLIGKNAIASEDVLGQTWGAFMAVLRTPANEYLRWVLNSTIFTARLGAFSTSTINQLTSPTLHSLQFAMPPERERKAIADHLTETTASIDHASRAATRAIALARERRSALISAAVTGKIDVGVVA